MNAIVPIDAPLAEASLEQSTVPATPMASSLLNFVAMAVRDPSVDVTKLEALLRMQREIVADDGRVQFYRSLGAFAAEVPQIGKAGKTDKYKFAKREDMDDIIRPLLTKHGLVLSFRPVSSSLEAITVEGELVHVQSGYSKTAQFTLPPDFGPGRNNLQAFGSSKAYAERYLTEMLCGLVRCDEDNDGNRLRGRQSNDGDVRTARPSDDVSSRTQIDELYALLAECSADPSAVAANERAFLTRMNLAHLSSMADACVGDFVRLRNALLTKKSILQQRRTQAPNTQPGAAA